MFADAWLNEQTHNILHVDFVLHVSELVKSMARFGVLFGRSDWQLVRNIMLCMKRYLRLSQNPRRIFYLSVDVTARAKYSPKSRNSWDLLMYHKYSFNVFV